MADCFAALADRSVSIGLKTGGPSIPFAPLESHHVISPELRYELIHVWGRLRGFRIVNVGLISKTETRNRPYQWADLQNWCISVYDQLWAYGIASGGGVSPVEVLEIGCGQGVGLKRLAKANPDIRFIGVDLSRAACIFARLSGADARHGRSQKLPFGSESFDSVISIESLFIFENAETALAEIRRVLKIGGRLISAEFTLGALDDIRHDITVKAAASGLRLVGMVDQTADARRSIVDGEPQRDLFHRKVPSYFRAGFREALSLKGTMRYETWVNGSRSYYFAVFEAV